MARPPFDPSRTRAAASAGAERGGSGLLTPAQVNEQIRGILTAALPSTVHVLGEIGDLSRPASGHLYFTLRDARSELRAVMWRSAAANVRFELKPGMEVIATGGIEVYTPRGSYQLVVRKLEPRGIGALELAFRQMRERLERSGLFDPSRKRALKRIPRRICVITSPSGAALRDILQTIARRYPAVEIVLLPVRVQGDGAAKEIAEAIERMNRIAADLGGVDVAIVGRGGGSLEDLWAFNEEIVARAIFASEIPIVSAVGHEIDVSISDLVADVRAATPTAAAELVTPLRTELAESAARTADRCARAALARLQMSRARLDAVQSRDALARPLRGVQELSQRLDEAARSLDQAFRERLAAQRQRLARAEVGIARFGAGVTFARVRLRLDRMLAAARQALLARTLAGGRRVQARDARLEQAGPARQHARRAEHVRQVGLRLEHALLRRRDESAAKLAARALLLAACDPGSVLRRGYSIARDARTRAVLRSIRSIRDGLRVATELADGEFLSSADDPRQPRLFDAGAAGGA